MTVTNNLHKKGLILGTISILLMSVESPFIKLSMLDSYTASLYLGLCLFISTNFIMLSKGTKFLIYNYTHEYKGVLLGGLSICAGNFCFINAVIYAGVANTVLILATTPILSALAAWIFLKKSTHVHLFIATFFIFIGLYIILQDKFQDTSLIGILFAFACVGTITSLLTVLTYFPNSSRVGYIGVGGLLLFIFSLFFTSLHVEDYKVVYILILGLFTMPISRYLLALGSRYIYPQEMSLLMILESIIAPLFAWWWLDEALHVNTLMGGAIVFTTLIIYFLFPKK